MCGIAGVAGAAVEPEVLARMAAAMATRGPDGEQVWSDGPVGFAHRRLAIIDLDPRSGQPMHLGSLHLVFNGEIYNYRELRAELEGVGHRFTTTGDTEVLLHAWQEWGRAALDRLNGMFAFGVWDERDRTLTLARDPFGEKPLYYRVDGERLVFGSGVDALAEADPRAAEPDEAAVRTFVARGLCPPPEATFFAGVRRLPAAHVLRWQDGSIEVARYWEPRRVEVPGRYEDAVAELRALLLDSIALRLRSDVPVGTSLSGGVDSSAVVTLSAELAGDHRRHAFTARFPGFERDEWAYAEQVARAAGVVEHHAVEPRAKDLLADLGAFVASQQEPVEGTSVYAQWRVMRAAREAGVTVLLDGQGADELFAGYPPSIGHAVLSQGPAAAARALLDGRERTLVLRAILSRRLPARAEAAYWRRSASPYAERSARAEAAAVPRPRAATAPPGPLGRELADQAFAASLPILLRYADRSSMAHSREVRLPFLDRRVAELALSLPAAFLYRGGRTKAVLRDAVRGIVPAAVLDRTDKVGYEPPQARWLSAPAWRERMAEVLLDDRARSRGLYDPAALEEDLRREEWRDHRAAWRAVNVELWLRDREERRSRPAVAAARS